MELNKIIKFYAPLYGMTILAAILPFLIVPYVVENLSVENFGIYNLAHITAYFILPVITLGMQTGARLTLSNINENINKNYNSIISSALSLTLALSIVVFFILWIFGDYLYQGVFNLSDIFCIVYLSFCISIISFLNVFYEIKNWFLIRALITLVSTTLIYAGIYFFIEFGPMIRIYMQIIVFSLIFFTCFYLMRFRIITPQKKIIKKLVKIGLPLTAISLFELLVMNIDKIIILRYLTKYDLGIYTGYFYFFTLVAFGAKPLSPIIETFYYQKNLIYKKILKFLILVLILIFIILIFFNKSIANLIFGEDFLNQSHLMIFFFFLGITKVIVDFYKIKLVASNKQYSAAKINGLIFTVGIISMFIIIPVFKDLIYLIMIMIIVNVLSIISSHLILNKEIHVTRN